MSPGTKVPHFVAIVVAAVLVLSAAVALPAMGGDRRSTTPTVAQLARQVKALQTKDARIERRLRALETRGAASGTAGPAGPAGAQGPAGVRGVEGPQGPAGPAVPGAQVLAAVGVQGASSACGSTPLATSTVTVSSASYLLVTFGGSWTALDPVALSAGATLQDQSGAEVARDGIGRGDADPLPRRGFVGWTGFLSAGDGTRSPLLVPPGTYRLRLDEKGNTPCQTLTKWEGIQLVAVAVPPA